MATEATPDGQAAAVQTIGAYCQREEFIAEREKTEFSFVYITNDGSPQHLMWLVGLKNIFAKQLPNMPKEYITRLVLDRRHRSVALVRKDDTVLGGITYRAFEPQRLGEIAFCAVTASEQVRGLGTRLMNYTKDYARDRDHLTHFLTYADNNAVGYFEKQGFTQEVTLEKERWVDFIKDYDGGTLMECVIHPKIRYSQQYDIIRVQREALESRIFCLSNSNVVHEGLSFPKGYHAVNISSIPGVVEAGWSQPSPAPYRLILPVGEVPCNRRTLQAFMEQILFDIKRHRDAWPFLEPVSAEDVPDYYDVVKDPMDLRCMQERLDSEQYYITLDIFVADLRRIFTNCRHYNAAETIYVKCANKLEAQLNSFLDKHLVPCQ